MDSRLRLSFGPLAVIAVTAWTTVLAAQEAPRPAPVPHPFGQMRAGVLSFTPTLQLTSIGLDTNVFNRTGTTRQSADFTATVEPGLDTRLTTARTDARVSSTMSLVYYRKYATERAINPGVDGTIDQRLSGRLSLYGKGGIGYVKERSGFEIDNRPRRLEHATTVGARIGERKLEVDLHGSYDGVAYDPDAIFLNVSLAETMNHTTRGVGGGVTYRLTPYTSMTTAAEASATRYEFASDRDTNSYAQSVGVQFHPRAMLAGTAGVGYRVLRPLSVRTPDFGGFTPRAGLTYRLRDVLTVGVGAQRDVETSFYSDRPYFLYTLYEASIRQALFHHFDVGGSIQRTTLEYAQFVSQGVPLPPLAPDVVRMLTGSVGIPVVRTFRVSVYVQRWQRLSADRPYGTTRAGLEMTVGKVSMSPRGVFLNGPGR
jgi:hypothetical protein